MTPSRISTRPAGRIRLKTPPAGRCSTFSGQSLAYVSSISPAAMDGLLVSWGSATSMLTSRRARGSTTVGSTRWSAAALSDIDDLDACVATVACRLRPGGPFVFSILHPCFPGGQNVSWPSAGRCYDEGRWSADGSLSTLRRQVGANHRMLLTYINPLRRHDLLTDKAIEPQPPLDRADQRHDAMRFPVSLW
jgi:hypothetical protein